VHPGLDAIDHQHEAPELADLPLPILDHVRGEVARHDPATHVQRHAPAEVVNLHDALRAHVKHAAVGEAVRLHGSAWDPRQR
jgi:hypothetical protein